MSNYLSPNDENSRWVTALFWSHSSSCLMLRMSDGSAIKLTAKAETASERLRLNYAIAKAADRTEFNKTLGVK